MCNALGEGINHLHYWYVETHFETTCNLQAGLVTWVSALRKVNSKCCEHLWEGLLQLIAVCVGRPRILDQMQICASKMRAVWIDTAHMRLCLMQDHALILESLLYCNPMVTLGLPYLLKNFLSPLVGMC